MAVRSREGAGCGRGGPPLLLLLCLWLPGGGCAAGSSSAPRPGVPASLSGVGRLLETYRRQLRQERPLERLELELRAGGGPREGCPGPGGGGYSVRPDSIIRVQDSIAAGASFLRAPAAVRDPRRCVEACCSEPRCSVAVVQLPRRPEAPAGAELGCYLFNCTARGQNVCKFVQHQGYSSYSLHRVPEGGGDEGLRDGDFPVTASSSPWLERDESPLSKAGEDVVLHLPTDRVVLDGRDSTDDHAIVQYEWTLLQGDSAVDMKVPQLGTLKLSHLREGTYTFQLTVTDTAGQRSSDNVSVTVLPTASSTGGCSKTCSRYHFFCDNGCCIDITLACDGEQQCPDGSDEAFCQSLNLKRKVVTHKTTTPPRTRTTDPSEDARREFLLENPQKSTAPSPPAASSDSEERSHSAFRRPGHPVDPEPDPVVLGSSEKKTEEKSYLLESKRDGGGREHPAPEAGAVLPLALGLAITALLLLMVTCRLRLVKQKLKKARPITSEESDYLINGMYL